MQTVGAKLWADEESVKVYIRIHASAIVQRNGSQEQFRDIQKGRWDVS
jgi:hypothetical protein